MRSRGLLCVLAGSALLACSGAPSSFAVSWSGFATATEAGVPYWKVWLCKPGSAADFCHTNMTSTVVSPTGAETLDLVPVPTHQPVDCFYVYPTVSMEKRGNSDLVIHVEEKADAVAEAAQFEQVCRMYAPMYHQVTAYAAAFHPNYGLEYDDVLAAWRDYLAHDNDGRGVVLIGHSEGSFILQELIRKQIEKSASERRLVISAILVGGDVTVADGSNTGGDFTRVSACRSETETGCVVAYSTWDRTPPKDAAFEDAAPGHHVLCVNPAAPGGGTAAITPIFPWFDNNGLGPPWQSPPVQTVFISFPDLYTAHCVRQGNRAWLMVDRVTGPGDPRPTIKEILNPAWGLHAADMNVELGNLLSLVRSQSKAWLAHH
ncbi:MAG TPA: DUF3089 domain-containing protein [Gaiellaceae bacterium]|nr:DUF3089 domain-containing protein [Gaiellaceae bacterium]